MLVEIEPHGRPADAAPCYQQLRRCSGNRSTVWACNRFAADKHRTGRGQPRQFVRPGTSSTARPSGERRSCRFAWRETQSRCPGPRAASPGRGTGPASGSMKLHWKPPPPQPQIIEPVPTLPGVGNSVDMPSPQPLAGDSMLMRHSAPIQAGRVSPPLRSPWIGDFLRSISGAGHQRPGPVALDAVATAHVGDPQRRVAIVLPMDAIDQDRIAGHQLEGLRDGHLLGEPRPCDARGGASGLPSGRILASHFSSLASAKWTRPKSRGSLLGIRPRFCWSIQKSTPPCSTSRCRSGVVDRLETQVPAFDAPGHADDAVAEDRPAAVRITLGFRQRVFRPALGTFGDQIEPRGRRQGHIEPDHRSAGVDAAGQRELLRLRLRSALERRAGRNAQLGVKVLLAPTPRRSRRRAASSSSPA